MCVCVCMILEVQDDKERWPCCGNFSSVYLPLVAAFEMAKPLLYLPISAIIHHVQSCSGKTCAFADFADSIHGEVLS